MWAGEILLPKTVHGKHHLTFAKHFARINKMPVLVGMLKIKRPFSRSLVSPTQRGAATKLKTEPNPEGHEDHEVQKYNMN